jgi:XTP/dITP diphosphohydrolase
MFLVFASNNAHKLAEVRAMMPEGIKVLSLHDIGFEAEIEETGTTLEENSSIKAETVYRWLNSDSRQPTAGIPSIDGVFADDTGLEIDALGGEPGVYTARWHRMNDGKSATASLNDEMMVFAANRAKALRELEGHTDRGCQFRTVITLIRRSADHRPSVTQVEGVVRGRIATEEYGEGGFGYDPVFIPEGYDKTFGELPPEIKNQISHRARAMEALAKVIKDNRPLHSK